MGSRQNSHQFTTLKFENQRNYSNISVLKVFVWFQHNHNEVGLQYVEIDHQLFKILTMLDDIFITFESFMKIWYKKIVANKNSN